MTAVLNANQNAIVQAGTEPLLVVAGPGAGKTTVLQHRIDRLLRESAGSYSRILGITFTTVAANNLRARLDYLADAEKQRLEVGTYHAFAARILQQHGSHLGLSPNFVIAVSSEERSAIAGEVMDAIGVSGDARKMLPLLSRLYERGATAENLDAFLQIGEVGPRFSELYQGYKDLSIRRGQIDFALLIYLCNELFSAYPAIPKQLRRVYRHICVDEFQDTNDAQFHLLELLVGANAQGLLCLADQDQIVYQWNGASPRRLRDAQERFGMEVLLLPTSFRCPEIILNAANRLIAHNTTRFVAPVFETAVLSEGSLGVVAFESDALEYDWIAEQLLGISPDEFGSTAVLARSRRLLDGVKDACDRRGVEVVMPMPRYEFESAPLSMLHNMLRSAALPGNEVSLERVTGAFYEMTGRALDPAVLRAEAGASSKAPLELFFNTVRAAAKSPEFLVLHNIVVSELVKRANYRSVSKAFFAWVDALSRSRARTAYEASYMDEKAVWLDFERLNQGLQSEGVSLSDFLRAFDLESKTPQYPDTIKLLTAHGAKGLEFDQVFIVGAAEGQFPAFQAVRLGERSEPMEEERRSFFVAITRCRRDLTISYSRRYAGWSAKESRFVKDMQLTE